MPAAATCRFGLYLGIKSVSYVKLERQGADWRLASSGELEWHDVSSTPEQCQDELLALLQKLMKQEGIGREPAHVSLHSRLCVTRVTTGNRQQVDEQLAEIIDNSQHYLQLGLGDKLIGHTAVPIDESRQYGQVAIIKRGLIETLENATGQAGLELLAVDGALTSICRLAQLAELDRSPLLLVWLGASGAEIGISYQGHLQLNYHAGESLTVEQAAETVGKHLKRLRRFCDRYRQVDCHSDLKRVLVLASPHESDALRMQLQALQFEQVYTLSDLPGTVLGDHLGHTPLTAPGVACALGGLLVHHASQTMPTTDVYSQYLRSKPQPLGRVLLRDGWPLLVSAALLLGVLCSGWSLAMWVAHEESQTATLNSSFDVEREQLLKIDAARSVLAEYQRVGRRIARPSLQSLLSQIASCLPEDCRIESCTLDTQGELAIKGMMLQEDRTYELLRALRDLPAIDEVALESVGRASNYGKTATLFEIHCELVEYSSESPGDRTARGGDEEQSR